MRLAAAASRGLLAALLVATAALAQPAPKVKRIDPPKTVLFVGNSFNYYNNSLHGHLRNLVNEADKAQAKSYTFKSMTISGGYLLEHEGGLPHVVRSRKWDVVILQGQSTEPMEANKERSDRFKAYARQYDRVIRESGAKTAFFMTWAYQDKPEMTAPLAEGYTNIANELEAFVVPVGLAFERSLKARPELVLHFRDKQHPSLAGTYLAACTFYAALFGKSPEGIAYAADLDKDTAAFLQGIAWETVKAFY
ncbi:MAG: DUF4886 domain-containing protein [Burkholderiales bacterium]|nr:DUF4886 domain-containing protein [Burkholderiales bacterium]MCL4687824.1 DUF4886 domain-containing protein [Burkholderiales bacterium]